MHCRYANIIVWYTLQTFFLVFLYLYFVWICQVRNRVIQTEGYAILCETFLSKSCTNMVVKDLNRFLHLHEIVEGLYFHCSLSVCLSVCVRVRLISCEQNSSRTDALIWTRFSLNGCLPYWLEPNSVLKLVTLGQRSRSRWPRMYVKMMKKIRQKFISRHFWNFIAVILIPNMTILQNK